MAINQQIYLNGIRGFLSHYEIDTLPEDYEVYKPMFHDATERYQGTKHRKEERKITNFIKNILCLKRKPKSTK